MENVFTFDEYTFPNHLICLSSKKSQECHEEDSLCSKTNLEYISFLRILNQKNGNLPAQKYGKNFSTEGAFHTLLFLKQG